MRIVLGAAALAVVATAAATGAPSLIDVRSTLAGVVLADGLVQVGDQVEDGQALVYVRTPLTGRRDVAARARGDGIVRAVLAQPGQRIEPGDVVVRLEAR